MKSWQEALFLLCQVECSRDVAAADDDLGLDGGGGVGGCSGVEVNGEEGGHARGRVVAGAAREDGEGAEDLVGGGIKEEGTVVGEDEEVSVGGEVDERVEVVLVQVGGFIEEWEEVWFLAGLAFFPWDELVAECPAPSDHYEISVRKNLLTSIPIYCLELIG